MCPEELDVSPSRPACIVPLASRAPVTTAGSSRVDRSVGLGLGSLGFIRYLSIQCLTPFCGMLTELMTWINPLENKIAM